MIYPNMATTLVYLFTDATLSNDIFGKLLKIRNPIEYVKIGADIEAK